MKHLHPGARWLFRIGAYVFFLFFVGFFFGWFLIPFVVVLGQLFGNFIILIVFLFIFLYFCLVVLCAEIYARMSYNRWFYEFNSDGLKLERGIIWKRYSTIPYSRMQNVDVHRGIIARLVGFSTVDIQTAGYSGGYARGGRAMISEGHIPAVSISEAEEIREKVMKKISGRHDSGL